MNGNNIDPSNKEEGKGKGMALRGAEAANQVNRTVSDEAGKGMRLRSRILFEDNHLLIFNKLPGEIVQGDKTGDVPLTELIKQYLKEQYQKPGEVFLGLVHRLDRPVSGAVLFTKTSKALTRMNRLLKSGEIRKIYWAVVLNPPAEPSDHLVHYLVRNEKQNKSYAFRTPVARSRKAELDYRMIATSDRYYLLEVELLTGRHHQIRSQLASLGSPIKGDLKYGSPRSNPDGSIHLHSRSVEFLHPVRQQPVRIVAELPQDRLWDYFSATLSPSI